MLGFELAAGLLLLLAGGEFLVRGSVAVARHLKVSPLVIGLVLCGFGTSAPELAASLEAALLGAPGIAVGNVVGSNIANVLLILGAAALITPLACDRRALARDGGVLLAATLAIAALLSLTGTLLRWQGALLLLVLAAYLLLVYRQERRDGAAAAALHEAEAAEVAPLAGPLSRAGLLALAGVVAVVLGAGLLVDGAVDLAQRLEVPDSLLGLTLVAVGTSLPELATSLVAAARRHTEVAFGNALGSNLFNLLGILGATALVRPLEIPPEILGFDLWVLLAVTLLLIAAAFSGRRISRREGLLFLLLYAAYLAVLSVPGLKGALGLA